MHVCLTLSIVAMFLSDVKVTRPLVVACVPSCVRNWVRIGTDVGCSVYCSYVNGLRCGLEWYVDGP